MYGRWGGGGRGGGVMLLGLRLCMVAERCNCTTALTVLCGIGLNGLKQSSAAFRCQERVEQQMAAMPFVLHGGRLEALIHRFYGTGQVA